MQVATSDPKPSDLVIENTSIDHDLYHCTDRLASGALEYVLSSRVFQLNVT